MAESPLVKKLHLKPGHRALVLNAPPGYLARLSPLPERTEVATAAKGTYDFVHLFVANRAELATLGPRALRAVRPRGVLWIAYPKKTAGVKTDLTRDNGWEAVTGAGWAGVSLVAIDDTWSALRFRPAEEVGT